MHKATEKIRISLPELPQETVDPNILWHSE